MAITIGQPHLQTAVKIAKDTHQDDLWDIFAYSRSPFVNSQVRVQWEDRKHNDVTFVGLDAVGALELVRQARAELVRLTAEAPSDARWYYHEPHFLESLDALITGLQLLCKVVLTAADRLDTDTTNFLWDLFAASGSPYRDERVHFALTAPAVGFNGMDKIAAARLCSDTHAKLAALTEKVYRDALARAVELLGAK